MFTISDSRQFAFNPAQVALARRHTYTLFGRLYLDGLVSDLLHLVQATPELATTLPTPFNADEAAADHQHLFGFNLFPYESIFLGSEGLLGGAVTMAVSQVYQQAGFTVDTAAVSPDHIGHELGLLAFLCGAEADAWEDGLPAVAGQMRRRQCDFLQAHLLRWLFPFVLAIRQQGHPFYVALAGLTLDLIHHHYIDIRCSVNVPCPLSEPPALLENEKTGLREIASYLTTPVYSGIYLSRDAVSRLARQQRLPRGFGSRAQMLLNLMRSAGQYDAFSALLAALQEVVTEWRTVYTDCMTTFPELVPFAKVWRDRISKTVQIIDNITTWK